LAINVRGYGLELYRMRDWSFGMKLNMLIVLILGLALWGCPPTYTGDDDDDNDDNGDDDTGDDDTGDDDTGDDDTGDDDTGDDDTGPPPATMVGEATNTEPSGYIQVQSLAGGLPTYNCPDCDYAFDITYTSLHTNGTCDSCVAFADGIYPLGWMSSYSIVVLYIYYPPYAGWYLWYYGSMTGNHVEFYWDGSGYSQYGYWDITPQ